MSAVRLSVLMKVAGVDEAGRGCVIGPLVLCAYAVDEDKLDALKLKGVKDSKLVLPSKRGGLHKMLLGEGEAVVVELSAEEITEWMQKGRSLNELEAKAAGEALTKIDHAKLSRVILDSPDPVPAKFAARVKRYFKGATKIVSENKADYNYTVVGAASIVAKEVREQRIAEIKREVGFDFGSGYSHDEVTIAYLKEHIRDPKLHKYVRHSWATAKRLKFTQVPLGEWV